MDKSKLSIGSLNALSEIFQSAKQPKNSSSTKDFVETATGIEPKDSVKIDRSLTKEETKRCPMAYKSPQEDSNRQANSKSPMMITPKGDEAPNYSKTSTRDWYFEENEANKIARTNQKDKESDKNQKLQGQRDNVLEIKQTDHHLEKKEVINKGFSLSPQRKKPENPNFFQERSKIEGATSESKVSEAKEIENPKNKYISPQKPSILPPTAKNNQYQKLFPTQAAYPSQPSTEIIIPENYQNGGLQNKSSKISIPPQNQLPKSQDFQQKSDFLKEQAVKKIEPRSEEQGNFLLINALSDIFSARNEDEKIDNSEEIKIYKLPEKIPPIKYIQIEEKKAQPIPDPKQKSYSQFSASYEFRKQPAIPQPKIINQKLKNDINYDPIFDFITNFNPSLLSCEDLPEIPDTFTDAAQYEKLFLPWFYEELKEHALHGFALIDRAKFICSKLRFTKKTALFRDTTGFEVKFQNHDVVIIIPLENSKIPLFSSYIESAKEYKIGIIIKNKKENYKILLKKEQNLKGLNGASSSPSKEEANELNRWNSIDKFAVVFIEKLVPDMREFKALKILSRFNLLSYILNPAPPIKSELSKYSIEFLQKNKQFFNESQYSAIREILQVREGISLLQGPPGTGKTRTIMGLISGFFENLKGTKRPKILVCAPSNIAIDEIALRIIRDGLLVEGRCTDDIYPIRIGKRNGWEEDKDLKYEEPDEVKQIRLEFLTEKGLSLKGIKNPLIEIENLKAEMDKNNEKIKYMKGNTEEKNKLICSIKSLEYKISNLQSKLAEYYKQKNIERSKIRNKANIILCTLSGAGSEALQQGISFDYVIVDEACQCIELSCIIPFQYGAKHAVLVGDPNQLPATIFSKSAVDHNYDRSLFERLCFNGAIQCHFLSIQYRMNKEICDFPNKFFYNERLECEPGFFENRKAPEWIPPLNTVFINLESSEESRIGNEMSFKNNAEAAFIADLYDFIKRSFANQKTDLGIITPYRKQVEKIEEELNLRHSNWDSHMEINTVDGFQGREKDVIILSLVRTTDVGFLVDKRRMNVSLTRAKFGLWVVGNEFCLENDESWAQFMKYCKENDKFISCSSFHDIYKIFGKNIEGKWNGVKLQESESERQDEDVQRQDDEIRLYNSWEEC
ncbi:unnamed protein product [Blepharisma stoltei]|uniref:Uncharacterized protein n=1 Tax=Blepharisma stoltei TaxID=1481888 RepID=A0AAU9JCQ2_9CILI|nr:unnamed protein product [Blepharisma stoltei]